MRLGRAIGPSTTAQFGQTAREVLSRGVPCPIAQRANCSQCSTSYTHEQCAMPHDRQKRSVAARAVPQFDLDALAMPEIDGDIKSLQVEMGAIFNDDGLASTFNNKAKAMQALETGVVLLDRSHWGRLRLSGKDRMSFLQNQSTADFRNVQPGQGVDTVFVTSTARTLDIGTVLVSESGCVVVVSPSMKQPLLERFNKYIFPADDVKVHDLGGRTAMISLLGPEADNVLRELGGESVIGKPYGTHQVLGFRGRAPLIIMSGSGLSSNVHGYTIIADETVAGDVYAIFAGKGAIPMGEDDWNAARVLDGRPAAGAELTEEFNPLEAGLYHAVSLNKGCYIGQETLSKLALTNGVKQQLWGLQFPSPVQPGTPIYSELTKVGVVTSTCQDAVGDWVGLGYIRSRVNGTQIDLEGVRVAVDGMPTTVVRIPYATRAFTQAAAPPQIEPASGDSLAERAADAKQRKSAEKADIDAAKAARLKAMEDRLAAWQAQQGTAKATPDQPQQ